jgi:hypothetical protein
MPPLISFGLITGFAVSIALGVLFVVSRSYRKANNRVVIHLCQLFAAGSVLCGLLFVLHLTASTTPREFRHEQSQGALVAFAIGLGCGTIAVIWRELKWRKAVGLDEFAREQRQLRAAKIKPWEFIAFICASALTAGLAVARLIEPRFLPEVPKWGAIYAMVSSIAGVLLATYLWYRRVHKES